MTKFIMRKKVKKNNLTINYPNTCTSSYHEENACKVSYNRYKTVRGVVLTRNTNCLYIKGEK